MKTSRLLSRVLAISLLAGFSAAQTLDVDVKLIKHVGLGTTSTIGGTPSTKITLSVAGGPALGQAIVAYSGGVIPPFPTAFGDLLLNPGSLSVLGTVPLDGSGDGFLSSTFGPIGGKFQVAFQVATVDPVSSEVLLTGAGQFGYGTTLTKTNKVRVSYSHDTQAYKVIVTNMYVVGQPVLVEHVDASAGQTFTIDSGTVPPGAFPGVSVLEYVGSIDLDAGDSLTVKVTGAELARIDA